MERWLIWFGFAAFVIFSYVWGKVREKEMHPWKSAEIILLSFLVVGGIIDILQTYFAVCVFRIAHEANPLFGHYPDIRLLSLFKLTAFVGLVALRPFLYALNTLIFKKINISEKGKTILLKINWYVVFVIPVVVAQWGFVAKNELFIWRFVVETLG